MKKVKVKLKREMIIQIWREFTLLSTATFHRSVITEQAINCVILDVANIMSKKYRDTNEHLATKRVTVQIPESYALFVFGICYGNVLFTGFSKVAIDAMLIQLEQHLFKSGKYQLENRIPERVRMEPSDLTTNI